MREFFMLHARVLHIEQFKGIYIFAKWNPDTM